MTNAKSQKTPNDKILKQRASVALHQAFELRYSFVIWHSSFVVSVSIRPGLGLGRGALGGEYSHVNTLAARPLETMHGNCVGPRTQCRRGFLRNIEFIVLRAEALEF
jgi:hypothetical protein